MGNEGKLRPSGTSLLFVCFKFWRVGWRLGSASWSRSFWELSFSSTSAVIKREPYLWELLQTGKGLAVKATHTWALYAGNLPHNLCLLQVDPGNLGRVGPTEAALFLKKSGLADVTLGKVSVRLRLRPVFFSFFFFFRWSVFVYCRWKCRI